MDAGREAHELMLREDLLMQLPHALRGGGTPLSWLAALSPAATLLCGQGALEPLFPGASVLSHKHTGHI